MKRITLTRKGFREWLEGKVGNTVVGHSCARGECPIATYLRHAGMEDAGVTAATYGPMFDEYGGSETTPVWAVSFIDKIDKGISRYITARQALAVLDGKES